MTSFNKGTSYPFPRFSSIVSLFGNKFNSHPFFKVSSVYQCLIQKEKHLHALVPKEHTPMSYLPDLEIRARKEGNEE